MSRVGQIARRMMLTASLFLLVPMTTGLVLNLRKKSLEESNQKPTTSLIHRNKPVRPIAPPRRLRDINITTREKRFPDLVELFRRTIEFTSQCEEESCRDADSKFREVNKADMIWTRSGLKIHIFLNQQRTGIFELDMNEVLIQQGEEMVSLDDCKINVFDSSLNCNSTDRTELEHQRIDEATKHNQGFLRRFSHTQRGESISFD